MNEEYPTSEGCYFPRLERTMRDIPDKYHDFLWSYTGEGKSPHVVQAAVEYIETEKHQDDCAEQFNTNAHAIAQAVQEMIAQNVVTLSDVRENNSDSWQQFAEDRNDGKNQFS